MKNILLILITVISISSKIYANVYDFTDENKPIPVFSTEKEPILENIVTEDKDLIQDQVIIQDDTPEPTNFLAYLLYSTTGLTVGGCLLKILHTIYKYDKTQLILTIIKTDAKYLQNIIHKIEEVIHPDTIDIIEKKTQTIKERYDAIQQTGVKK